MPLQCPPPPDVPYHSPHPPPPRDVPYHSPRPPPPPDVQSCPYHSPCPPPPPDVQSCQRLQDLVSSVAFSSKVVPSQHRLIPSRSSSTKTSSYLLTIGTVQHQKKSKLSSIARELHGPLHTTGRKHSAQLRLEMDQFGEQTDKMSVWIKARDKQNPDVAQVIEEFENYLLNEPENQRGLAVVRDRIFHHIMGKDRHGYCRTFGSSMPRSLVYPKSSSFENTTDLLKMISEQLNQFGERLEKLEARVISIENKERNTNETKRRDKLNQRMKTLQKLVPSSSKLGE
ncbi:hypothetical protein LINPERPRIM_LOCUS4544 [Linum perenne]